MLTAVAYQLGFWGEDLGVIFLFFAVPTAVSSFIMAEAMHCNSRMAGDIISISTLGSILTIPLGLILLSHLGWI
jgi:predicted permease